MDMTALDNIHFLYYRKYNEANIYQNISTIIHHYTQDITVLKLFVELFHQLLELKFR